MAAIVMSLIIIPIGGASTASAAAKPAKAMLPLSIVLQRWDHNIVFDHIRMPDRATSVQIYMRGASKYVKTVKKGSAAYKKYKKSKSYILEKVKGKAKYRVYKAGKWKRLTTTAKTSYKYSGKLKYSKIYQLKVRGKNKAGTGKFCKTVQFKTQSKKTFLKYKKKYNDRKTYLLNKKAWYEENVENYGYEIEYGNIQEELREILDPEYSMDIYVHTGDAFPPEE